MTTFSQRVVWTAIPRGNYGSGTLHLAVAVIPQLSTDSRANAHLANFPDFALWPATLAGVSFSVVLNGMRIDDVEVVTAPGADSDVWRGAFPQPSTTLVRPFRSAFDMASAQVRSFPAADLVDYVRSVYSDVLGNDSFVTELPSAAVLRRRLAEVSFYASPNGPGGFGDNRERRKTIAAAVNAELANRRFVPAGFAAGSSTAGLGVAPTAFVQHTDFLNMSKDPALQVSPAQLPTALPKPERDFHEYVSMLGHYRDLVRLLGFALDLKVTLPQDMTFPPDPCDVQLIPHWTPSAATHSVDVTPITKATLRLDGGASLTAGGTGATFVAHSRPVQPLLVDGRLPLDDTARFTPIALDHDGAAIKVQMLAEDLDRQADHDSTGLSDRSGLPALRSGGISLAVTGAPDASDTSKPPLAGEVVNQIDAGVANAHRFASDVPAVLWAEDLTRGFRFDIYDDDTSKWHSLSARTGSFSFTGRDGQKRHVGFSDEAIHQLTPSQDPAGANDAVVALRQQQTMFHWTGWSLGAHRPGRTTRQPYRDGAQEHPVQDQEPAPSAEFPLGFEGPLNDDGFANGLMPKARPGTLPRLRFGQRYWIRARAADLVGDSVDFGDPTIGPVAANEFGAFHPASVVYYARFEPVQSPPLVFHDAPPPPDSPYATGEPAHPTAGESIERLVIRSNYQGAPAVADPATPTNQRHVVPPKTSVEMVERHGLLDAGSEVNAFLYGLLAVRDEHRLPSAGDADHPASGAAIGADNVTVDWLPDPMARGVTFVGLPGTNGPFPLPFFRPNRAWYSPTAWRINLQEGSTQPDIRDSETEGQVLDVFLPKGDTATVRVSAHLLERDPDLFAIYHEWLDEARRAQLHAPIVNGRVWAFTPWRTIKLVHAVRQPLVAPAPNLGWFRDIGDTSALLGGAVAFSRKSTGRMDFHGRWPAPVDRGPGTGVPSVPPNQPAGSIPSGQGLTPVAAADLHVPLIAAGETHPDPDALAVDVRHEFGDTKRKPVTYTAEATTAFAEYFRHRNVVTVTGFGRTHAVTLAPQGISPRVTVRSMDGKTSYPGNGRAPMWSIDATKGELWFNGPPLVEGGGNQPADGVGGKPAPRLVVGDRVQVVFIPQPLTRLGAPVLVDIPASARPLVPDVALLTPAFGWSSTRNGPTLTSTRQGNLLRVYLRRPWWTSGAEEKLAVVLPPPGLAASAGALPKSLDSKVTLWGADPAYASAPLPSFYLTPPQFPDRVSVPAEAQNGFFLDEVPFREPHTVKVDVAAHDVFYDAQQDLWYSDIRITAGDTYMPFVRLALARFQPHAASTVNAFGVVTDDVHLSRIVLADFAQLAPDRSATVVSDPSSRMADVSLFGLTYNKTDFDKRAGGRAYVTVQRQAANATGDLSWTTVSRTPMSVQTDVAGKPYWFTRVDLGAPRASAKFRLLIDQHDVFGYEPGSRASSKAAAKVVTAAEKLVHSDVIPL